MTQLENKQLQDMIKTTIQAQVVMALNSVPEAIDALVKAALSKPVDEKTGGIGGYGEKVPYLDYIVGEQIRFAAREAVRKVLSEHVSMIEDQDRISRQAEREACAQVAENQQGILSNWRLATADAIRSRKD